MIILEIPSFIYNDEAQTNEDIGLKQELDRDCIKSKITLYLPNSTIISVNESHYRDKSMLEVFGKDGETTSWLVDADYDTVNMLIQEAINKAEKK